MGQVQGKKINTTDQFDFSEFPLLETKRLILRDLVLTDAADIFVFRSDAYVQRYNSKPLVEVSEAEAHIKRYRAAYFNQERILWAVTLKGQGLGSSKGLNYRKGLCYRKGTVIGLVGFSDWSRNHNRAMLGYDLTRAYWGQGIGSEAVREIIRFGFERMHLNRIEAETIEDNHESVRMLEKIGFTREGIRRGYSYEDDGEYHGSAMYGLLRSDL